MEKFAERLEKVGEDWRSLEKVGKGCRKFVEGCRTDGEGWRRLEKVGEDWRSLEKVGKGCRKLEKVGES